MQSFILDTVEQLDSFKKFVTDNYESIDIVSFDLETDSVEEVKANLYGIGLSFQEDEGFYIPIRTKEGQLFFGAATQGTIDFVSQLLLDKRIIAHNGIYDVLVWRHSTGVDLTNNIHADTILMKHCIDENPPFGLKETAVSYLGDWADKAQKDLYESIEANGGSTTKTNLQMFKADTNVLGVYCTWDVMLTYKLFNLFSVRLEEEGLLDFFYEEEVMPLYREVTIPMKYNGVKINVPFFSQLLSEAQVDISTLEEKLMSDLSGIVSDFTRNLLEESFPEKKTGNFAKKFAQLAGLNLTSLNKKTIDGLEECPFKAWMQDRLAIDDETRYEIQLACHLDKSPELPYIFNLRSKTHLKWLFFDKLGLDPLSHTDGGAPQVDEAFLSSVEKDHSWIATLKELNTIEKIRGTYLQGILDRTVGGRLYTSFLQFGTTSGRYASRNPNCQNWPAPQKTGNISDKYVNAIRYGIVSSPGNKLIGLDFSSLEPHIAAYVSGDKDLIDIFVKDKDFYSAVAIKQFGLNHLSAYKKDPNYLGEVDKDTRNKTKTYSLAAFYGASGYRIAEVLGCGVEEATELLNGYLDTFPGIRKFINKAHYDACHSGKVRTVFGRVRHLDECKKLYNTYGPSLADAKWARQRGLSEQRSVYKNLLNNAVNFQIQGTAGHVMNRAMLKTKRLFDKHNINARIIMTIHDEQIIEVEESQATRAAELAKLAMETAVSLEPIKLKATPVIGDSYGECK